MNNFKEIPRDMMLEKYLQENHNRIEGLPLDTPLFNDDHYHGTIPPTLSEWISEPVFQVSMRSVMGSTVYSKTRMVHIHCKR